MCSIAVAHAQFSIDIETPDSTPKNEVIIYTLNGSKDVLTAQAERKGKHWKIDIPFTYRGMLKAYFPDVNKTINFISENKDVHISFRNKDRDLDVDYIDNANKVMQEKIVYSNKKDKILPALVQIKEFYNDSSDFDKALEKEIAVLKQQQNNISNDQLFMNYYFKNLKYAEPNANETLKTDDYIKFLTNSNEYLESSSLLKPVIINFLRSLSKNEINTKIDQLLEEVNIESPRGQNILAELLDIFETYGLEDQKNKYFKLASELKCSINKNLESSISAIKNTMIGSSFPIYNFSKNVKNTKAKNIEGIKSKNKIILFWSSTCPHCMSEVPQIINNYALLKKNGYEVIAFSLDNNKESYDNAIAHLPWINDTELKGWDSSYTEKYNVHATPTYYVLDANNKIIDKPINFKTLLSNANLK